MRFSLISRNRGKLRFGTALPGAASAAFGTAGRQLARCAPWRSGFPACAVALAILAFSVFKGMPVAAQQCPNGQVWSLTGCIPQRCPDGQRWNAVSQRCVQACSDGKRWNPTLQLCIPVPCPQNEVPGSDGRCQCRYGYVRQGTTCVWFVLPPPRRRCPPGQILRADGRCVAEFKTHHCPEGEIWSASRHRCVDVRRPSSHKARR